jgi:ABC-type Fe3+/spermidine/putrescine transport system ATPase subunit
MSVRLAMDAILELRQLSKHYPGHHAVRDISLSIQRGEFFSLVGPSGCGKTTTLRLVAGFEAPTGGGVWLNGERIDHLPPYRRNVNTVFQSYALFPHLTVRGNVEFGLRRTRAKNIENIDTRVQKVLEQVRLAGKESRKPSDLSGGERQRVALARSLVLAPDVLLLDEPLSALDPQLRKQVRSELKDLQRRVGVTFLFVTHDQEEALSLSDRVAVMNSGALEQVGTPQEIYQRPRTRFVASFLGSMNWIDGIGVRPEAIRVSRSAPPGVVSRRGTVTRCTFLGSFIQAEVQLEDGAWMLSQMPVDGGAFADGEPVHVFWNLTDEIRVP